MLREMRGRLAEVALIESSTGSPGGHNHHRGPELCPVCQRRIVAARYQPA